MLQTLWGGILWVHLAQDIPSNSRTPANMRRWRQSVRRCHSVPIPILYCTPAHCWMIYVLLVQKWNIPGYCQSDIMHPPCSLLFSISLALIISSIDSLYTSQFILPLNSLAVPFNKSTPHTLLSRHTQSSRHHPSLSFPLPPPLPPILTSIKETSQSNHSNTPQPQYPSSKPHHLPSQNIPSSYTTPIAVRWSFYLENSVIISCNSHLQFHNDTTSSWSILQHPKSPYDMNTSRIKRTNDQATQRKSTNLHSFY